MRLKATWEVMKGIVPGQNPDEVVRFHYTEAEHAEDLTDADEEEDNHFTRIMKEAHRQAQMWTDPNSTNWVRIDFIWY